MFHTHTLTPHPSQMVEYLVGDGPNNRYALICSSCHSHNGMALRDEFEYVSFRCAYCYHLNPARKSKPALRPPSPLPNPTADGGAELGASATNQVEPRERRSRGSEASQSGMEVCVSTAVWNRDSVTLLSYDSHVMTVTSFHSRLTQLLHHPHQKRSKVKLHSHQ